jgi:glycerol dehydrogenase-like iron-containing ADH family enzyme
MNEEKKNQIIKAFSYSVDLPTIAENTGLSEDELRQFLEDNKEAIAEEMAWNRAKAGC